MTHTEDFAKGLSIGIIMDGNGRWAKKNGLPRTAGHGKGAKVFWEIFNHCKKIGVSHVTFYAFSTENWSRPEDEVSGLMKLFAEHILKVYDYEKENIRVVFLGDRTRFSLELQEHLNKFEDKTKNNTGMVLNMAMNYGGRQEILHAVQKIAQKVQEGCIAPCEIDLEMISNNLYTAGQKDPDFILRPSGEHRLSNFMLWQASYAEFVDMDVLWPDFTTDHLDAAIEEYNTRSRRFGGL